jgi:predicted ATP-grasp superfamily ATP-dependent carboligase
MKRIKNKVPAVVFGLFETGLGIIRSLGMNGITVYGIDHKKDIAWYSRYVRPMKCPNLSNETQLTEWLKEQFKGFADKLPVFITSDDFLSYFSRNREELADIFIIDIPPSSLIDALADKYEQFKLAKQVGVTVPKTWVIKNSEEKEGFLHYEKEYPLFLKGLDVNSWRQHFGGSKKGFVLENRDDLNSIMQKIDPLITPVVIQELIGGSDTAHYKYSAYIDEEGNALAEFMLQKIRQYPIHFGVGAAVKSIYNEDLLREGRRLFKGIKYRGVGSAEFKWDARKNAFTLIELNPRYWQQNYLATFCGLNFPLIQYQNLVEKTKNRNTEYDTEKLWINRYMDFSAFVEYRKEGVLTLLQWCKSIKGKKVYPDFLWNDPVPLFYEFDFGLKFFKAPVYLFKKLLR